MKREFNKMPFFAHRIIRYFGLFMVIFYLVLGFLFIFSSEFFPDFNQTAKWIFGGLLIIYGIFRAYRVIINLKDENTD
jgi:cytochrome c biogenesis protein CcdA